MLYNYLSILLYLFLYTAFIKKVLPLFEFNDLSTHRVTSWAKTNNLSLGKRSEVEKLFDEAYKLINYKTCRVAYMFHKKVPSASYQSGSKSYKLALGCFNSLSLTCKVYRLVKGRYFETTY